MDGQMSEGMDVWMCPNTTVTPSEARSLYSSTVLCPFHPVPRDKMVDENMVAVAGKTGINPVPWV